MRRLAERLFDGEKAVLFVGRRLSLIMRRKGRPGKIMNLIVERVIIIVMATLCNIY